jgi:hypothetical protein
MGMFNTTPICKWALFGTLSNYPFINGHFIYDARLSLYRGVFNILKITTTTHNNLVCISFNSKSAHSNPPIYIYMQKADSLSFSNGIRVWGLQTESS